MNGYVYVLHFEEPLSHAKHYVGSSEKLRERLTAHANGAGSNLCRVLWQAGIEWHLGGLYTTSHAGIRRIERGLKNQHNAHRYCSTCSDLPAKLTGCIAYPIDMMPFTATSKALRTTSPRPITIIRKSGEGIDYIPAILNLMKRDKDALGFIPAGGDEGIQLLHDRGQVLIATENGEPCGYLAFTLASDGTTANIQQCVVDDGARLLGHGRSLVEELSRTFPAHILSAKVRDDLAANEFWLALQFSVLSIGKHKTSGSTINHYIRLPEPPIPF